MEIKVKGARAMNGGLAVNGKEAVEKYKELKSNIVTMDLVMEEMDGIPAIKEIKRYDPNA